MLLGPLHGGHWAGRVVRHGDLLRWQDLADPGSQCIVFLVYGVGGLSTYPAFLPQQHTHVHT